MAGLRRVLLGLWLEIRVIPVLLWSFTAITLGTALAWRDGDGISVGGYLAAVAVGVLLQGLVAHCVNEIADWRSGTDRDPAPRVISGGSKVIASGLLGTRELRLVGFAAAIAATVLGILAAARVGLDPAGLRRRGPRRSGALHAAAGAGRLPPLHRRGGRLRLHLGLHDRRLRAPARRAVGRRRAGRHRLRGLVRGDADDAPLPRPHPRQPGAAAEDDHDRPAGPRRAPLRRPLGGHRPGRCLPADGAGGRPLRHRRGRVRRRPGGPRRRSTPPTRPRSRAASSR